ncbi:uncharacterized protein LOC105391252 [Plutella xylostella]|uniref:uncharacterized protein LOC105391252 n=1 Tax=Plutella xylostella TaxID=51655 RepID=UPI002032692B|nr:uncharacterized protein LOC105391252 [Plutella xylostella]
MSTTPIDNFSDEEIFFGKLSLKEVKKHLFNDKPTHRQTIGYTIADCEEDDNDKSLTIIETNSEPDIVTVKDSFMDMKSEESNGVSDTKYIALKPTDMDVKADDSFLTMEQMVSELSLPSEAHHEELDNTLDIVNYILNHGKGNDNENITSETKNIETHLIKSKPSSAIKHDTKECVQKVPRTSETSPYITPAKKISENIAGDTKNIESHLLKPEASSAIKHNTKECVQTVPGSPETPSYITPVKIMEKIKPENDSFSTPAESKIKTPIFKTPANIPSHKKPAASSTKKTPLKSNAYQHIKSPIASYINKTPQVPLVKDVRPMKPLPGPSSIPKIMKTASKGNSINKENINLPSIAYRSAKETKLIDIPSEGKLPQSQWAKKIVSSLPRPLVIKHNHREHNFAKKVLLPQQEDSFADLSLHQADVSVCIQKSAFFKSKH